MASSPVGCCSFHLQLMYYLFKTVESGLNLVGNCISFTPSTRLTQFPLARFPLTLLFFADKSISCCLIINLLITTYYLVIIWDYLLHLLLNEGITYIHFFTYFFWISFQKNKIEPARIYYLRDHCDLLTMISWENKLKTWLRNDL